MLRDKSIPVTGKRQRNVKFTTFDSDRNQGFVYELGKEIVIVYTILIPYCVRAGCTSTEIVQREIEVVELDNRLFEVKEPSPWEDNDVDCVVSLPYGFRPALLFPRPCPYCGK